MGSMKQVTRLGLAMAAVLLGAGWSAGCAGVRQRVDPTVAVVRSPGISAEERISAIDVQNLRGSVTIEIDETLAAPEVTAWVRGTGASSGKVPQWVGASVSRDAGRPVLRVLSAEPTAGMDTAVSIVVRSPKVQGLRVRNAGGPVLVRGIGGSIEIENGSPVNPGGRVEVNAGEALASTVTVTTFGGGIGVTMPEGSMGTLTARSAGGVVTLRSPRGQTQGVRGTGAELNAAIGGGGRGTFTLQASGGDVAVEVK
jgi:hypothetical protein